LLLSFSFHICRSQGGHSFAWYPFLVPLLLQTIGASMCLTVCKQLPLTRACSPIPRLECLDDLSQLLRYQLGHMSASCARRVHALRRLSALQGSTAILVLQASQSQGQSQGQSQ
jgi:hypothetical protein